VLVTPASRLIEAKQEFLISLLENTVKLYGGYELIQDFRGLFLKQGQRECLKVSSVARESPRLHGQGTARVSHKLKTGCQSGDGRVDAFEEQRSNGRASDEVEVGQASTVWTGWV
jgi:hypothetical protein